MRRFDAGYAAAKKQIDGGRIGTPLVFKSTSRDPFRPSLEYANPKSSGGMLIDMGIHDFDLARWFMGDVRTRVGDRRDDRLSGARDGRRHRQRDRQPDVRERQARRRRSDAAAASTATTSRRRSSASRARMRIGYLRETPIMVMTKNWRGARHGAVFHGALPRRLHDAAAELRAERAAGSAAADHDRRRARGAANRRGRDACARERHVGRRRGCHRVLGRNAKHGTTELAVLFFRSVTAARTPKIAALYMRGCARSGGHGTPSPCIKTPAHLILIDTSRQSSQ